MFVLRVYKIRAILLKKYPKLSPFPPPYRRHFSFFLDEHALGDS